MELKERIRLYFGVKRLILVKLHEQHPLPGDRERMVKLTELASNGLRASTNRERR